MGFFHVSTTCINLFQELKTKTNIYVCMDNVNLGVMYGKFTLDAAAYLYKLT
ncbi:hypothetical protein EMIT0210MI2_12904 [Priestia megaterium]